MEHINKFKFKDRSTCLISGPTSSGKTYLMLEILRHRVEMFERPPDNIIWCYKVYQPIFDGYRDFVGFNEGIYDPATIDKTKHNIVVLDDCMMDMNQNLAETFTVYAHHLNITVFFLAQNLFHQNKFMRNVSLNTHTLILFSQRRDVNQIGVLAAQMFPDKRKEFLKLYKEATSKRYGYLVCDLHPSNTHRVLLRTNILPDEIEHVYVPE